MCGLNTETRQIVTPLRLIFWGGIICVLDFTVSDTVNGHGWKVDLISDFVGKLKGSCSYFINNEIANRKVLAWQNGYGRSHEDQADRVGLRYAYEAGYDITRGPELWRRFARKYGQENADHVLDMLFGNYTHLCLLASTSADLDACRDEAREVAAFCAERWNMSLTSFPCRSKPPPPCP